MTARLIALFLLPALSLFGQNASGSYNCSALNETPGPTPQPPKCTGDPVFTDPGLHCEHAQHDKLHDALGSGGL
jgi:hypothetical protein